MFVWTVNKEMWMEWSIRHEVDGVISDDPKRFLEVCKRWGSGHKATWADTLGMARGAALIQVFAVFYYVMYRVSVMRKKK